MSRLTLARQLALLQLPPELVAKADAQLDEAERRERIIAAFAEPYCHNACLQIERVLVELSEVARIALCYQRSLAVYPAWQAQNPRDTTGFRLLVAVKKWLRGGAAHIQEVGFRSWCVRCPWLGRLAEFRRKAITELAHGLAMENTYRLARAVHASVVYEACDRDEASLRLDDVSLPDWLRDRAVSHAARVFRRVA